MLKTLSATKNPLASANNQLEVLDKGSRDAFEGKLKKIGLHPLKPGKIDILQINLGKKCNQACEHCHVDAGPDRKEIMTQDTMKLCLEAIKNSPVTTVDLTGGAPEMNPNFQWLIEEISSLEKKIIVRSNLTILVSNKRFKTHPEFFKKHHVIIISSLPCYTAGNVDKQRGKGVFADSIEALKMLNEIGYGKEGTGLELHLVFNPIGASLPPSQDKLERDYKLILGEKFGITFNNLLTITNLPISRFLNYLLASGKYDAYMEKLMHAFNPATALGLMCRNTISVGWNGFLYDCDFNQMLELKVNSPRVHIRDFNFKVLSGRNIVVNQHCYGCTAGAGSSCQGAIV